MRAKYVNEAIKHLAPRSEEEIQSYANWRTNEFLKFLKANNAVYAVKPEITNEQDLVKFQWRGVNYAIWIYWEMATLRRDVEDAMKPWIDVPQVNTVTKAIEYLEKQKVNESVKHLVGRPVEDLPEEQRIIYAFKNNDIEYIIKCSKSEKRNIRKLSKLYLSNKKISFDLSMRVKITKKRIDPTGKNDELTLINYLKDNDISYRYLGTWMGDPGIRFTGKARNMINFLIFSGAADVNDMHTLFVDTGILESIKHLQPRSTTEIIDNIEQTENLYHRMYMGLTNNIEDVVQRVFDDHETKIKGNKEEDTIYMLGSFFLTNEELSFSYTLNFYLNKEGKFDCTFQNETDEYCQEFSQFLEDNDIQYEKINTANTYRSRVKFTGNARDIIRLVLNFFVNNEQRYEYVLDEAYDIIFTG